MTTKSQLLRKEQLLSDLLATRQRILAEVESLSSEQREQVFLGTWSVKDLLEAEQKDEQVHLRQITDFFKY